MGRSEWNEGANEEGCGNVKTKTSCMGAKTGDRSRLTRGVSVGVGALGSAIRGAGNKTSKCSGQRVKNTEKQKTMAQTRGVRGERGIMQVRRRQLTKSAGEGGGKIRKETGREGTNIGQRKKDATSLQGEG